MGETRPILQKTTKYAKKKKKKKRCADSAL